MAILSVGRVVYSVRAFARRVLLMEKKSWSDVVKPSGSILPNWHIILAVVFSLVAGIGLLMTSEEPMVPQTVDPFDIEVDADPARMRDESEVAGITQAIQADADARARDLLEARRRAEQEAQRRDRADRLEAQERERAYREALRTLEVLRSQPAQPGLDRGMTDNLAETSSEAEMRQAIRMEELQRQNQAYRAPMVASSARGIGEEAHALERPEITESYERPPELRLGTLRGQQGLPGPPPVPNDRGRSTALPGTVPSPSGAMPGRRPPAQRSPGQAPGRAGPVRRPGHPFAAGQPGGARPVRGEAVGSGQPPASIAPPVAGPGAPQAVVQAPAAG